MEEESGSRYFKKIKLKHLVEALRKNKFLRL